MPAPRRSAARSSGDTAITVAIIVVLLILIRHAGGLNAIASRTPSDSPATATHAATAAQHPDTSAATVTDVSSGLRQVHTPKTLVDDMHLTAGQCHFRWILKNHGVVLPDAECTPGAVDPAVTQATIDSTICVSGYTATVRPSDYRTRTVKVSSMAAYSDTDSTKTTELDHLVSLSLGGSSSV